MKSQFAFNVTPTDNLMKDLGITSERYRELYAAMRVAYLMYGSYSEILSECSQHTSTPQELIFMGYLVQYYKTQREVPAPNLN